jgi:hypothetical protein
MDSKPVWQSKTLWIGLLTAVAPFWPPAAVWIAANPAIFSAAVGAVFSGLRLVSNQKVTIS